MDDYYGILISQFCNDDTLNIFCDASIIGKPGNKTGCYGVVGVVKDRIIDSTYRLVSYTTSNNSEIKGLRAALDMAHKYKDQFQFINIFSDSQVSVYGLKDYIYRWKLKDGILYTTMNNPVASQEVFIEAHHMLVELEQAPAIINIFHQSGHIDNGYSSLHKAADNFKKFNNIKGKIDINFIRYISSWNNYVDNTSRSLLRRNRNNEQEYIDPVHFTCENGWL